LGWHRRQAEAPVEKAGRAPFDRLRMRGSQIPLVVSLSNQERLG
jgi:hypothetical protein